MPHTTAQVVVVSNAGQGYGRAIALAYGLAGVDVVCADADVALASKTAAEIEALGGQAIPVQADVSVAVDIEKIFTRVHDIFGALSGVVHVSKSPNLGRETLSETELHALWHDGLKASLLMLRYSQRYMPEGWFVLVAPVLAATPLPGVLPLRRAATHNQPAPHVAMLRGAFARLIASAEQHYPHINSNMVTPSRVASDPYHDHALVESVRFLGAADNGISGQHLHVHLPPPPKITEALLPEVRAALDASVRQDDLSDVLEPLDDLDDADYALDDGADDYELNGYALDEDDDILDDGLDYASEYDDRDYDQLDDEELAEQEDEEPYTYWHDEGIQLLDDRQSPDVDALEDDAHEHHSPAPPSFEPLAFEDTAAQLEAALAADPANDWYVCPPPRAAIPSTPATRALPKTSDTSKATLDALLSEMPEASEG